MLVALGFLSAGLVALVVAPAFWARAVRMTDKRLRERLPVSEDEVRADKDRIRAEAAVRVHKLEMRLEQSELAKARHRIEISRRDDNVAALERSIAGLTSTLDEHQNARRVLEQTVSDRLPKVEQRLTEAKGLLFNRDREIAELTQSTKRQQIALEEATSINTQQNSEMKRLSSALTTRGARNGQSVVDPKFESELALRAEIEALRAKSGEQASLISRLQSQMNNGLISSASFSDLVAGIQNGAQNAAPGRGLNGSPGAHAGEQGLSPLPSSLSFLTDEANERVATLTTELRNLQTKCEEQASEVASLSAELKSYRADVTADPNAAKDSRIALKARLSAVEAVSETQTDTIRKLRTELAGANERLALQAAHFMDEMRRLGAGTLPTSAQQRRPVANGARQSLAERVTQARPTMGAGTDAGSQSADVQATPISSGGTKSGTTDGHSNVGTTDVTVGDRVVQDLSDQKRRPRLLDRISSLGKP
jgi:chromosome segregation ATPase